MTHEDVAALLHELHAGELPAAQVRAVADHLADCEDCRTLSLTWRVLRGAVAGTTTGADHHLSTEEVVSLAIEPEALSPELRRRLESHLPTCTRCADDVGRCRQADRAVPVEHIGLSARVIPTLGWTRWGALAAGIMVALLLYPAYLGLVRLPEARSASETAGVSADQLAAETNRLRAGLETHGGFSGSTRLHLLSDLTRGGESAASTPVLRSDDPVVLIGIDLLLPEAVPDKTEVTFVVADGSGAPVTRILRTAELVRRDIREAGVVTLVMTASKLLEGSYHLRVTVDTPPEQLFEARFRVVVSH